MPIESIRGKVMNGGRVTGLPAYELGTNESPDCRNIDPSDYRGAVTRPGSALWATSAGAPTGASGASGIGLFHWTRNNGTTFMLAAHSGTLYTVGSTSATWASILTGLTGNILTMKPLNDILVIVGSGVAPQMTSDASGVNALTGTPPSNAKYLAVFKSKLWMAGDPANPQKINFSASNSPVDWTTADDAGSITVEAGDGDTINGILSTQNVLLVFKRKKVYGIFGDAPTNFVVIPLHEVGLVSEFGYAAADRVAFFASDDGIYSVAGGTVALISNKVKADYDAIADKSKIALGVRGNKLFVTDFGAATPYSLVLDFKRGVWSYYESQPFKPYTISRGLNFYGLTNASTMQIYQLDTGTAGSISPLWTTPHLDFGDPSTIKTLSRYWVHMKPDTATTSLTVLHLLNGATSGSNVTLTFGTVGSHDVQTAHGQNKKGRYLTLQFQWSGVKTLYGWSLYADIRGEPVPGRGDN